MSKTNEPSYIRKLNRADEHARAIEECIERWFKRNPCELFLDCDLKTREHRYRVAVFESPPEDLQIPISECVHNARTALEHIAYRLATHVRGTEPSLQADNTTFPLVRDPARLARFNDTLGGAIGSPKRIPAAMGTALYNAQPCHGGDATNLGILEDLNNCDKHRFPPLLVAVAQVLEMNVGTFSGSGFHGPHLGPHEHGAIVAGFTPDPHAEVDMDLRVRFDVAFGLGYPGEGAQVAPFLTNTLRYIRETLVPAFEPFL